MKLAYINFLKSILFFNYDSITNSNMNSLDSIGDVNVPSATKSPP